MKKFIALALTLAMMVSCLVFTASAESGVVVAIQGPETVTAGSTFQVKVRVTDPNNVVGGVQGVIDVTGAKIADASADVLANPELQTWNKTTDNATIYKVEDNDVTFAALNSLEESSYATRLWFMVTYTVTDADAVSVALKNVKVSDKAAALITDVITTDLAVDVANPETDPVVTLDKVGILKGTDDVEKQAINVAAGVSVPDASAVTDIGVVFYPTSLLGGAELTVDTQGAIVANVNKTDNAALFNSIVNGGSFNGLLNFGFSTKEKALAFLGTRVTARVYYKTADGVVYSSNASDNAYINNGTANKAALNTIIDFGDTVTAPVNSDLAAYQTARAALNTDVKGWQNNREFVLKYAVANANVAE